MQPPISGSLPRHLRLRDRITLPPSRPISPGGLLQDTGLLTADKSHTMTKHCDCALITFKGHQ